MPTATLFPRPVRATLLLAALAFAVPLHAQVTIRLTAPAATPPGATVHVAGSFNQWNPNAAGFALTAQPGGGYAITLPDAVRGSLEFKFTLGSWETVETTAAGEDVPNRTLVVSGTGPMTFTMSVAAWRRAGAATKKVSTASRSVSVISDSFAIPQLGRSRRVWLYLPPDYATSAKRYPVLYMHDGQNVFDAATGFAGEWGVDETLDSLQARGDYGAIVVAVDHGGTHRLDEYNPWLAVNREQGGGQGDAYVEFLVHTLKPYIDQHYRTRPDRLNTGIMGSSMGGLISLYAALKYPDVFGRSGVFSCACWIAETHVFDYARHAKPVQPLPRFYFVAGGQETIDGQQTRDQARMVDTLRAAGFPLGASLRASAPADGKHSEWFWRREFPAAYRWLFADSATGLPNASLPVRDSVLDSPKLAAWTRGATCYEIFVRSFKDSDGDGIGDINGLISKLDYINDGNPRTTRDLGARCLWLMPMSESPSYHGYDVADYYSIEHDYGTTADFKRLMAEAHKRGIKVLIDLVLNHASSEHPYFIAASRDTASEYRHWFRWSPTKPADLNPWGQSNWHKSKYRDEWFYGFFSDRMPDLNYEYAPVREEAKKVADYWLREMNVDGFRLDAVPYLVEQGAVIQHSPGTHAELHEFGDHVRAVNPQSFTIGEVSDSTKELIGYYPDQLDAYFGFEVADSIISAVNSGSARGILPPVLRLQDVVPSARWSPFLSNHDQARTATRFGGDMSKARVAAFILFTMPGVPFVYYGEEIGMTGPKPDPRIRTPMQWSRGHAAGFTRGTPWEPLQPDSLTITVQGQESSSASLLNYYRRLIHLRDSNPALASGLIVPLTTSDAAVTAYLRRDGDQAVLAVVNVGATAATNVRLGAAAGALPPGRWDMVDLLGGRNGAPLGVSADSALAGYLPLATLAPRTGYLFRLKPARRVSVATR